MLFSLLKFSFSMFTLFCLYYFILNYIIILNAKLSKYQEENGNIKKLKMWE